MSLFAVVPGGLFGALPFLTLGLGIGALSGLLGIGGGVICVPALLYLLDIPIHRAVGISIAVIVPSSLVAYAG